MNVVVAVALLTGRPGLLESGSNFAEIAPVLRSVAVEMEILDPRETRYVFVDVSDFQENLDMVRRRWWELRGVGYLDRVAELPGGRVAGEACVFNRAYRRFLDDCRVLYPDGLDDVGEVIRETEALYTIWDSIRDARNEFLYVSTRREALKRIPETIPFCVPLWRFYEE